MKIPHLADCVLLRSIRYPFAATRRASSTCLTQGQAENSQLFSLLRTIWRRIYTITSWERAIVCSINRRHARGAWPLANTHANESARALTRRQTTLLVIDGNYTSAADVLTMWLQAFNTRTNYRSATTKPYDKSRPQILTFRSVSVNLAGQLRPHHCIVYGYSPKTCDSVVNFNKKVGMWTLCQRKILKTIETLHVLERLLLIVQCSPDILHEHPAAVKWIFHKMHRCFL